MYTYYFLFLCVITPTTSAQCVHLLNAFAILILKVWNNCREDIGPSCDMVHYPYVKVLLIPGGAVGTLIGRGGSHIKSVQTRFNVKIQGPRRNEAQQAFRFNGTIVEDVEAGTCVFFVNCVFELCFQLLFLICIFNLFFLFFHLSLLIIIIILALFTQTIFYA